MVCDLPCSESVPIMEAILGDIFFFGLIVPDALEPGDVLFAIISYFQPRKKI